MEEFTSLCGSEVKERAGSCFAELLALRFFRNAVRYYRAKKVENAFFGPLVRNIFNERCVFDLWAELTEDSEPKEEEPSRHFRASRRCGACDVLSDLWCNPQTRETCKSKVLEWTDQIITEYEKLSEGETLPSRLEALQKVLRLSPDELSVLEVLWLVSVEKLEVVTVPFSMSSLSGSVALYTGQGEQQVRQALMASSRLNRFGCLSLESHPSKVHTKIRYYLDGVNDEPLESSFYRRDDAETLPAEFFGKMAEEHLPILKRLLSKENGKRTNILLYGAPGTGKSSFARMLAKETGRIAYQVQQRPKGRDGEYREALAEIRYAAVEICGEQTDSDSSLIIVDEADSLLRCHHIGLSVLFGRESSTTGDKGLLNDILDRIETPIIWIANTRAEELDLSSRRRFDYAIRFEPLSREQRRQIWENAAEKANVTMLLKKDELHRLADEYPVNTGIVARALGNLGRLGVEKDSASSVLSRLLDQQCELSGVDPSAEKMTLPTNDYSIEGVNIKSSISLDRIEKSVRRFLDGACRRTDPDAPRMNILLTGVPGSGKTEFVKHLAAEMERPLLMLRASDLKSKWSGETEQNIAAAFRDARKKSAILFFDEVDTFLDDRRSVAQGHEKAMVNEMLQQMESFGGVFIGATNFKESLDPAVARRFTFKIEFDYLNRDGRRTFWKRSFGVDPTEEVCARLDSMSQLTPGDFRTVRQELYYLGEEVTDQNRLNALEQEVAAKSGLRQIGF